MKRLSRTAKALVLISLIYLLILAGFKFFHIPGGLEIAQAIFLLMLFVALKMRKRLKI